MKAKVSQWSFAELAARAGVPGRTIRFYIARGLLPGPAKAGRGAHYGAEHLARLETIRKHQTEGLTLGEIARRIAPASRGMAAPEPTPWWQYAVAEDVVVSVRGTVSPWRMRQIKTQLADLMAALQAPNPTEAT